MKSAYTCIGGDKVHVAKYVKVLDGRKQPICGLWERNGRFYAQLKIEDSLTGENKTRRITTVNIAGRPYITRESSQMFTPRFLLNMMFAEAHFG